MTDLEKAKSLLVGEATCVAVLSDKIYLSTKAGISPMMGWIADGVKFEDFSVADKIVGKAAAMLFVLAKISNVHAKVISKAGLEFLQSHNIAVSYDVLTEKIINRAGTGICPMEEVVQTIDDPQQAYLKLKEKLDSMKK